MLTFSRRAAMGSACLLGMSFAAGWTVEAQPYPSNTIRIVLPTPPGSPGDTVSRIIAAELSATEGWRMVIENRPGAIQTIGVADVLKQPADGHTIVTMSVPMLAGQILLPNIRFQLESDLAPVIKISSGNNVLVVHPSVPARSVSELIAVLKSQPDKFNFASGGVGNPAHLIGEMFKLRTGTRATHVPYPQGQQFVADLLSGTTQFAFITSVRVVDLVATGKIRALAVMGPRRLPAFKDVPTIIEEGFPNLAAEDWVGIAVKAGTSKQIIARLNEAMNKALAKQNVRDAFVAAGHEPAGGSPAEFGNLVSSQLAHWRKVIQESGIKAH